MKSLLIKIITYIACSTCLTAKANSDIKTSIEKIINQNEDEIDFAETKLKIDKLVNPWINVEENLNRVGIMVAEVRNMVKPGASSMAKAYTIRDYLYKPGPWNRYKTYQYDLDDPTGTKIENKLLPTYLDRKKGNCISMPILFLILADKIGLDVSLTTAPLHVLVKFTMPENGMTINIEPTSGGYLARDSHVRKEMPMTDKAINKGVYLAKLSRRQSVIVMAHLILEHLRHINKHEETIEIAHMLSEKYPNFVGAILATGGAYAQILNRDFFGRYDKLSQIPLDKRMTFDNLVQLNHQYFEKAEALGWQEPPKGYQNRYMKKIEEEKRRRQGT